MRHEIKDDKYYIYTTKEAPDLSIELIKDENQIVLSTDDYVYAGPIDLLFDEIKLYFVATVGKIDSYGAKGTRVVGYFKTLADAKYCIEHNCGDIYEDGYYPYALIEAVEPGLYPTTFDSIWYKWDKDGYKSIEKPVELKSVCNFTIG